MQLEELNAKAAEVLGWTVKKSRSGDYYSDHGRFIRRISDWHPCSNWADCGLLMDSLKLHDTVNFCFAHYQNGKPQAFMTGDHLPPIYYSGSTPQEAIVRAICFDQLARVNQ